MTDLAVLFADHIRQRQTTTETALAQVQKDALVLGSGRHFTYFADDQEAPFSANPHFNHWCPLEGPHHLLKIVPGKKPLLVRYAPEDFWYEQVPLGNPFWREAFELIEAGTLEDAWKALGELKNTAFIGEEAELAAGCEANPAELTAHLDWERSFKSEYEVHCLSLATEKAARGHKVAREAFYQGASELEIHHAYVQAVGAVDSELPYGTIVALNEKGAILHYQGKRDLREGKVLLIDAGARVLGYASDITRTYANEANGADPVFTELLKGMERLQQELCELARPGVSYGELHHHGHLKIASLLKEQGILRAEAEEAVQLGLSRPFFPHGLGHFLGLQVHDVAGKQRDPEGHPAPPPAEHPHLRTTRQIAPRQVFTVEPGLYFIPMLLRPFRENEHKDRFDWALIDRLTPMGGIRIEDNLLITETSHRNLTREHLSN